MFLDLLQKCCCERIPPDPLNKVLTTLRVIFCLISNFLCSIPEKVSKNICDRKFFPKYFLCTPKLWFWHPGLVFCQWKKVTQRFKEASNRKIYFYHLFLKVLLWTREMRLWQPCVKIFGKKSDLAVQITKTFIQILLFQESFYKCSSGHVGYNFANHALLFCWKSKFFLLKVRNW